MPRFTPLLVLAATLAAAPVNPPPAEVLVEICEAGIPQDGSWPAAPAAATESYGEPAFGLFELPHKYISTGVRADRPFPTLVRASATITLPPGRHRLLLRSRGAARLHLGGKTVLETPFDHPRIYTTLRAVGGEVEFEEQDKHLNLGPDFRFAPPGNREVWAPFTHPGGPVEVVLETLVGGREPRSKTPFRPELGETVAAVSLEGQETWHLLTPGPHQIPYTDQGWAAYEAAGRERLAARNAAARAARRAAHADVWNRRRAAGAAYLRATPDEPVPPLPPGYPTHNPIDHFTGARIAAAAADYPADAPRGGIDFHRDVRPLLEARCLQCHTGAKAKGGLRLDLRAEALLGGNADGPAIVPRDPAASALLQRVLSGDPDLRMPAKADPLPREDADLLRRWITEGAPWPDFARQSFTVAPLADDLAFLRRVTLDTVGVVPSEAEIRAFLADRDPGRRDRVIDRLLGDPRWADHAMPYWMDILAENPNLINPTLNNTGPFRWWLHESLLDNKPLDLLVTELLRLEGSERFGGPAGFGVASQNDVPAAAKGVILAAAFLGVEMKCARCHDALTHASKQRELFSLAAMLDQRPVKVPATSSVPMDLLTVGGRKPLVEVTLPPGSQVDPAWPFPDLIPEAAAAPHVENPASSRDRLAALLTAPENERFAQVMANRIWERLLGRGLVDSPGDWEQATHTHPGLLRWLGRELVRSGYDAKALSRLILRSHTYQRAVDPALAAPSPLYTAQAPRRIQAEQLVDSLFAATGKPFKVEQVNIDLDSARPMNVSLDLGIARRAWMLGSTSNERDRPSLSLPRHQAVEEVLGVFGRRAERPDAIGGLRKVEPNVLQPALLANGTMMSWLTTLSDDHGLASLALEDQPLDRLIDRLYLRTLTRAPRAEERRRAREILAPGYAERRVAPPSAAPAGPRTRPKYVAWSNHMSAGANLERTRQAADARRGDPPTGRLRAEWRERLEDVVWGLLNAPEWIHLP